ncbi:MAG: porphobilinogen synthase [Candidatus Dormibacteria bacterium]
MSFPQERPRRLRRHPRLRDLVRETTLGPADLILPIFVSEAVSAPRPIPTMPGVRQETVESAVEMAGEAAELGIPAVILFGVPARKDAQGSEAWAEQGVVQRALLAIRAALGERLLLIADLCLDEYTDHGHCGLLDSSGQVDNDATLELYSRIAISQARAGADVVAPSGMMDGQVGAIRAALDGAGLGETAILAYAAKYASAFYGPFREAAESAPRFGDRRGHQLDPANFREGLRELGLDMLEGADMLMVKPALPYLDLIAAARRRFELPLGAFSVSGEYAMLQAGAAAGGLELRASVLEAHIAIRRAGADFILSYFARDICRWLAEAA